MLWAEPNRIQKMKRFHHLRHGLSPVEKSFEALFAMTDSP
jgi:hypothetical protein